MSGGTSDWVRVVGTCRCSSCGSLVATTWRLFTSSTTWTRALCEPCVEEITEEGE